MALQWFRGLTVTGTRFGGSLGRFSGGAVVKIARKIAIAVAVAVAPASFVMSVSPAAEAAPNGCASGALCVYWDTFYRGSKYQFFGSNRSWGAWAIENDDSSWFNNGTSGQAVKVYENRGYSGRTLCLSKGTGDQIAWYYNDRGSSNLWVTSC